MQAPILRAPMQRVEDWLIDHLWPVAIGVAVLVLGISFVSLAPARQTATSQVDLQHTGAVKITASLPPPVEPWRPVRRPIEMISLQSAELERLPIHYSAALRQAERRDAISFGYFDESRPDMEIALRRHMSGARPSLFIEASRRQSERGVSIGRSAQPIMVQTKFGEVETSDMEFSQGEGMRKACLAFRSAPGTPNVVEGWMCASPGSAPERPVLVCFIDRLMLLKSGEDEALRGAFQQAERRRVPCAAGSRTVAGRKPTWLDQDGARPGMRSDETTGSVPRRLRRERD
jgi:hypothetical protein